MHEVVPCHAHLWLGIDLFHIVARRRNPFQKLEVVVVPQVPDVRRLHRKVRWRWIWRGLPDERVPVDERHLKVVQRRGRTGLAGAGFLIQNAEARLCTAASTPVQDAVVRAHHGFRHGPRLARHALEEGIGAVKLGPRGRRECAFRALDHNRAENDLHLRQSSAVNIGATGGSLTHAENAALHM